MKKIREIYVADFETTVYEGQERTDVWAAAIVPLKAPDELESVTIFGNIDDFMNSLFKRRSHDKIVYFHNLKFDGSFIINWCLNNKKLQQAGNWTEDERFEWWKNDYGGRKVLEGTYTYSIADKGMWYSIKIKLNGILVEIRDSLKLMPFSVKTIGSKKGMATKHQKLEMEYTGLRYPNCTITDAEAEYIKNDVLVVKEALQMMFKEGHDKLTIGACCLDEYKRQWSDQWDDFFPNVYEISDMYYGSVGDYIRCAYHGGWCYLVPEAKGKVFKPLKNGIAGTTADVNSLYPSMMHSDSGNYFPIGTPTYFEGDCPDEIKNHPEKYYYFIRIKTQFHIKEGYLPTIQIKGSLLYPGREWLTSSDATNKITGKKSKNRPELVLTMTDWEMLQKHYNLTDLEIIDGYYFLAMKGIFDEYINKYAKIKQNSKGARRTEAKLFLNNLYGKFSASTDSSFKVCENVNGVLKFKSIEEHDKKPGYIPIGAAITSYARRFTITAAQANYHPGSRGFIYADTDSIHCDLLPEEIVDAPEDPVKFNRWKYETYWSEGYFMGAKRYIEKHAYDDGEKVDEYYDIKCAGMGTHSKDLFIASITGNFYKTDENGKKVKIAKNEKEEEFIKIKRTLEDFKEGIIIPGSLKAKQIAGGVLLVETDYQMHSINKWI